MTHGAGRATVSTESGEDLVRTVTQGARTLDPQQGCGVAAEHVREAASSRGGRLWLLDRAPELCPEIAAFLDEGNPAGHQSDGRRFGSKR
ncbi:MAG TPA: hypothetical protein VFH23_16285 [Jiangellaceae bacterium]|nr:hypothetical protein [Jiangellaceae bacterium]